MKYTLQLLLLLTLNNLFAQNVVNGIAVSNQNDTLNFYFNLNQYQPEKRVKIGFRFNKFKVLNPKTNKTELIRSKNFKYLNYTLDSSLFQYYVVPVPSWFGLSKLYYGQVINDGNYKLLLVSYLAEGGRRTAYYYYVRSPQDEYIMVYRLVKDRSRNRLIYTCEVVENRIKAGFYNKKDHTKLIKDLNELCK